MSFPTDAVGSPYEFLGTGTGGFDFTADDLRVTFDWQRFPSSVVADTFLYLYSTYNGGSGWAYPFPGTGNGWVPQSIGFSAGWIQMGNTPTVLFSDALAQISLFGVVVQPILDGNTSMDFGLDNLQFAVPEPGEWAMILTVLGSVVFSLRRYRRAA